MSNERVTCEMLMGCGLSLEIVAGVDQEGPPEEEGAKAGFEELLRLQSFSNEGIRTSLGVQWSWNTSGYKSGHPLEEVPLQCLVIESISCIQCSTGKV